MTAFPLPSPDFQAIFEATPAPFLVLTPDFIIVAVSDAYTRATMTTREQLVGHPLFDMFPDNPDDPAATGTHNLRLSLERVLDTRAADTMAVQKYDIRKPEVEGGGFEERFWSPINSPVLGPDDAVAYIIHRVEDVTEFVRLKEQEVAQDRLAQELRARAKRMESEIYLRAQEIQAANRRLEAAERLHQLNADLERRVAERTAELRAVNHELEAFSYSVSHDLRAPLRGIAGFSQALLEDYGEKLDEVGRTYIQHVVADARTMSRLIDDLLRLSRVTRADMRRQPIDLSGLARAIVADLARREPDRAAEVVIAEGLAGLGDEPLLRVALENLLGNAWKFTRRVPAARIEMGMAVAEGRVIYFVRDNGAGFDPAYASKLFGAFQRLHSEDEFEGTGIGLATVRRIIQRHGGDVWAEGAVGAGATFSFTLGGQDP